MKILIVCLLIAALLGIGFACAAGPGVAWDISGPWDTYFTPFLQAAVYFWGAGIKFCPQF